MFLRGIKSLEEPGSKPAGNRWIWNCSGDAAANIDCSEDATPNIDMEL
jgi:hypothetical protein